MLDGDACGRNARPTAEHPGVVGYGPTWMQARETRFQALRDGVAGILVRHWALMRHRQSH